MGRGWVRDRSLVVVGAALIVSAVALAVWLYSLPSGQRDAVLKSAELVLAVVGTVITVLGVLRDVRRPAEPKPLVTLADLLAQAVRGQWRKAATERVLVTPAPIPVGWSVSELPVAGPVEAAVGDPDVAPAFPPLPGQTRVTQKQLRAGGGRGELFAVYAGIASGRMVVVGAPGAGKSGTAVLLLLDVLEHRDHVDDEDRARVPVPVLLTARGWDPATCSVQDWLAARLAADYPMFQHRGGLAEAAALVAVGGVALILDGLDEMGVARRPAALQALSDAPFRVVVLTRSQEMVQAASAKWLVGAVALHLDDVIGSEGADYLQRARSGPAPFGWTQLLTHLRECPDGVLARSLSTPLMLTLIRDTYRPDDDISDLLNGAGQHIGVDLEQHLIARVLPDAYTPRPGRPAPRYSLTQAEQALAFLARQMNQDHTRDLAWWQIPRWAPTTPCILASMLAGGLLGGLLGGLTFGLGHALLAGLAFVLVRQGLSFGLGDTLLVGLTFGLGVGLPLGNRFGRGGREPKRVRNWRAISVRSVLTAARAYGAALLLAVLFAVTPVIAFFAIVTGDNLNAIPAPVIWIVMMFMFGLAVGFPLSLKRDLLGGLSESESSPQRVTKSGRNYRMLRIAVGFPLGLKRDLLGGLSESESSPQGPLESWRNDRVFGFVVGLVVGFVAGLALGLTFGLVVVEVFVFEARLGLGFMVGLVLALVVGLLAGLPVGLVYGIMSSVTWSTTLAWLQLQRSGRVPAVDLISFLEDARDRGVLRTVGAVYQFRHATLQDQLARETTASPAISSAASLPE
jgi:hypothetical protein